MIEISKRGNYVSQGLYIPKAEAVNNADAGQKVGCVESVVFSENGEEERGRVVEHAEVDKNDDDEQEEDNIEKVAAPDFTEAQAEKIRLDDQDENVRLLVASIECATLKNNELEEKFAELRRRSCANRDR